MRYYALFLPEFYIQPNTIFFFSELAAGSNNLYSALNFLCLHLGVLQLFFGTSIALPGSMQIRF